MSWLGRIFTGDEELGKKDDDHRPSNKSTSTSPSWIARKSVPTVRKRRIIYGICALLFLYVFVKNIPIDLALRPQYIDPKINQPGHLPIESADPPSNKPKRPATPSDIDDHYYNGPIKFYKLASSLHAVARLGGQHDFNKNVLFAASNLKSASELIPLACEMARWERNDVHFAIMGRDDMDIREIKILNGAVDDCNVNWHDARPDFSHWSSDFRMEVSVEASLEHIHNFVHPQVIIIDTSNREDMFFVSTTRSKAMDIGKSIIELPLDAMENMMWITRLDSESLAAWKTTYVDLLIQAPSESSGSLVRLLKSIEDADYFGFRRPHLTVELPAKIDPPTWRYLEQLVWPPPDPSGAPHISQVSLRHRIPRRTLTEYEASARLIESFYPVRTTDSHVLLLSPQVELSPLYYHYLMYHLLEYRYSAHGKAIKDSRSVMGFSLELPTHHLDDVKPLTLPMTGKSSSNRKSPIPGETTPFLWQAPNSNAALYFSDKWIELHSFLTARLSKPPSARSKLISRKHPSWLEFLLELMRARGYALLYPGLSLDDESVVTVHDELYQIPEEFPEPISTPAPTPTLNPDEPLTVEYEKRNRKTPPNSENPLVSSSLLSVLPNSGDLPKIPDLPLLSFDGTLLTKKASDDIASAFAETYRSEIGGCESVSDITAREPNSALDLFCHLDEVYDPTQGEQHHGKTGHKDPANGDAIPIEDGVSENEKDSTHPTRHTGYGAARPQPKVQEDSSEETQIEFRAQMERQAKQAGLENQQEKKETDDGPGIDKKVKSDGSEQASPPESHAGLSKQIPKKPVEGLEEEAVQGKSPGW